MNKRFLTILLAVVSLSLIGAESEVESLATVATVVGSLDETLSQEERVLKRENREKVLKWLGQEGTLDLSSKAPLKTSDKSK